MRIIYLSFLLLLAAISCSKRVDDQPKKEDAPPPVEEEKKPSSSLPNEQLKIITGNWTLFKQISDMGPVIISGKNTLQFRADSSYTRSTLYDETPEYNKTNNARFYIEEIPNNTNGYSRLILSDRCFNCLVRFAATKDTMFLFNGVGTEFYVKASPAVNNSFHKMLVGNWEWYSGSVDHPPFFLNPESTPWYRKTLTFDESFHYKLVPNDSSAKAPRGDSGTYRILDTLWVGRQTTLICFYSGGLEKNKSVLPISLTGSNDSLHFLGGFSNDHYKKIP